MKKKIPVSLDKAYRLIGFGPVVLVTSFDGKKSNIMPVAWHMPINHDPTQVAICIGDHSYTFGVVKKTKEFVINVPHVSMVEKVYGCGKCSGKDTDKFKKFGLTARAAKTVKAPLIEKCIAHLECKVIDASQANKYNVFIAEVSAAWADPGIFKDIFQVQKQSAKTLHHLGANNFSIPNHIIVP